MSDCGGCDEFVPGCMCGCDCGVHRVAPDEARNGKSIHVGIFFCPLVHSRHEGRKGRFKLFSGLFSGRSFGCLEQLSLVLFRLSFGLFFGLPHGCLDRLLHIFEGHLAELPSLVTCLLIFLVVVVPRGADSGADYTSLLRRLVQGPSLHLVQHPVERGVPCVLHQRLR